LLTKSAPASIRSRFNSGNKMSFSQDTSSAAEQDGDEPPANAVTKSRYQAVRSSMRTVEPQPGAPKGKRPERDFCPVWRTADDLPAAARIFYQEASDLAAISLQTLTMAAAQIERRLEVWSSETLKPTRRRAQDDLKGKGRAQVDGETE
jgi:hypothetical protein